MLCSVNQNIRLLQFIGPGQSLKFVGFRVDRNKAVKLVFLRCAEVRFFDGSIPDCYAILFAYHYFKSKGTPKAEEETITTLADDLYIKEPLSIRQEYARYKLQKKGEGIDPPEKQHLSNCYASQPTAAPLHLHRQWQTTATFFSLKPKATPLSTPSTATLATTPTHSEKPQASFQMAKIICFSQSVVTNLTVWKYVGFTVLFLFLEESKLCQYDWIAENDSILFEHLNELSDKKKTKH